MIYFILWIKGLKGTAISKKVYTIFIFHLILMQFFFFELILACSTPVGYVVLKWTM
jgi:hypothetical protein